MIKHRIAKDEYTSGSIGYIYYNSYKEIKGMYSGIPLNKEDYKGKIEYYIDILDVPRIIFKQMTK